MVGTEIRSNSGLCICRPQFSGVTCDKCKDGHQGNKCDICSDSYHMNNGVCQAGKCDSDGISERTVNGTLLFKIDF